MGWEAAVAVLGCVGGAIATMGKMPPQNVLLRSFHTASAKCRRGGRRTKKPEKEEVVETDLIAP
jgi:hypothetical protein